MQKKSVNLKVKKAPALYPWMNPKLEVQDTKTQDFIELAGDIIY